MCECTYSLQMQVLLEFAYKTRLQNFSLKTAKYNGINNNVIKQEQKLKKQLKIQLYANISVDTSYQIVHTFTWRVSSMKLGLMYAGSKCVSHFYLRVFTRAHTVW